MGQAGPVRANRRAPRAVGKARRPRVIELRILGHSVTEIAQSLGVSAGTITHTLQLPEVATAIEDAHRAAREDTAKALAALSLRSVRRLADLMEDPETPAAVARQCAADILDRAGHSTKAQVAIEHSGTVDLVTRAREVARSLSDEDLGVDGE